MKRKITFLLSALFALTLISQSITALGQTYKKVTSAPTSWEGEYLLVRESSSTAYVWTGIDNSSGHSVTASISNSTITKPNDAATLTIESMTGGYSILLGGGTNDGKYIYGKGGNNPGADIKFGDNPSAHTISIANSAAKIVWNTNSNRWLQTNSGRFRYYTSGYDPVQLYKKAYSVSYNANGGSGTMTDSNSPYFENSTVTTKTNTFTNGGQTFTGWNTKANGTGTSYAEGVNFTITENTTLYAQWASATTVVTPSIYLDGGTYTGNQSTTISCGTDGASIYYTLDGTDPTSGSTLYSGAITIDHSCTLKAIGIKDGLTNSSIASATYTIKVNTPSFSPTGGDLYQTTSVAIDCEIADASIYYTMGADPADPTSSSTPYNGAISVSSATKIKAIAIKDGLTNSEIATATYTFPTVINVAAARAYENTTDYFNTRGVVTYKTSDGKTAYIQDATAAIAVYKNDESFTTGLNVGDEIVVNGKKTTYHGLVEVGSASIKAKLSTGNSVSPTVKTVAAINTDYGSGSGDNNFQSMYVKIEKATYNGSNSVNQGGNTIKVEGTMGTAVNGDAVTFTGIISCDNELKIINLGNVQIVNDPTIISASSIAAPNYIKNTSAVNIVTKNLAVTGANLESDITATLEDGDESAFEIKVGEGSWGKTATLTESEGSVNANITVRLKAGQNVADYSDRIILESTNATTVNVNITGSVTYANVTYNGNAAGVSNVPTDATDYTYNQPVTVAGVGTMTNTGHTFTGWNSKADGSGSAFGASFNITQDTTLYAQWTVNTHTLTLPATDAYGTYTADKSSPVAYGTKVTLTYTPEEGYENYLAQWSSSTVSIASDGTFTMPDNDVTVKVDVIPNPYIKDIVNRALTGVTSGSTSYSSWSNKSSNSSAKYAGNSAGGNDAIQLRTSSNAGVVTTTSGGKVRKVVIVWNTETAATRVIDVYGNNSAYSGVSDLFSAQQSTQGTLLGSATYKKKGDAQTDVIYIANDYAYIGIRSNSGALYIDEIQIFWEYVLPTDAWGNLTKDATIAENLIVHETNLTIPDNLSLTIEGTLIVSGTLTNSGDENNIYIADGGQLKFTNTGTKADVKATVEKNITGYTDDNTGWNFIASPINVSNLAPTNVTNMTSNTYDLYQLDPSSEKWQNYKDNEGHTNAAAGFNLASGRGYLYANSSNVSLEFAGTVKPYTTENDAHKVTIYPGWNLVGNPYTFNVFSSKSYYRITTENSKNVVTAVTNTEDAIAPCTGIVVKNTGTENDDVAFLESAPNEWATGNKGNIQMTLAQTVATSGGRNTETIDNAIVSFNEGTELEKFYFGNPSANIYIPQNHEEYAIVSAEAQGELPVNFVATEEGEYTITINPEEVEMSYLHLIDNKTGNDVDLLVNPSYTFNARTTDYASRFRLVFVANENDNENQNGNEYFAFISNGQLIVNGTGTIQIIDMMGRVISTRSTEERISTNGMTPGVYVLQLVNGTDVKTQKIVIR